MSEIVLQMGGDFEKVHMKLLLCTEACLTEDRELTQQKVYFEMLRFNQIYIKMIDIKYNEEK